MLKPNHSIVFAIALAVFVSTHETARAQDILIDDNFDTGTLESWTAGSPGGLYTWDGVDPTNFATSGNNAAELYNGGTITLTDPLSLDSLGYTSVTVDLNWHFLNGSSTRRARLEYAADGSTFTTVKTFNTPFGGVPATGSTNVTLNEGTGSGEYMFTDQAKFRFFFTSNQSSHRVYLDDIVITAEPSTCSPGDTDSDGDIDTGDLTTSIQNFTGAGGSTTKTCEEGDTDDDGDVDTGDLTFSIQNFTGAQAGNAGVPDLVYDPATGNVTIDADGADVISFSLQSGPFNAADFSELPAGLTDNIASQIGWTSFNLFSGLTGTANLGAILPAGLDLAQLEAALQTASYGLALAGGGGGGRLDLIIPEPASMVLIGLGAVALVRRRRVGIGA